MAALKGKSIDAFVRKRDPAYPAILVYGPDEGLRRERATQLAKSVVSDLNDPFNAIEFSDADLKAEPSRLADEMSALSFAGGERLIRLRTSGDSAAGSVKLLIDGLEGGHVVANAVVIIEGGDLAKTSKLRKLVEGSKKAVALPCYADSAMDVRALAVEMAAAEGLTFEQDALDLAVVRLGEDRGVSSAELGKLMLYVGPDQGSGQSGRITLADVEAVLIDTIGEASDEIAGACADGEQRALSTALFRAANAGTSPVATLRAMQRNFLRLAIAADLVAQGESPRNAMKRLRPPVFFKEEQAFERRLRRWSRAKLARALDLLLESEFATKTTGAPQQEIVERVCLQIAALGAAR